MVLTKEPVRVVLNSYRKIQTNYYAIKSAGGDYSILAKLPDATLRSLPSPEPTRSAKRVRCGKAECPSNTMVPTRPSKVYYRAKVTDFILEHLKIESRHYYSDIHYSTIWLLLMNLHS